MILVAFTPDEAALLERILLAALEAAPVVPLRDAIVLRALAKVTAARADAVERRDASGTVRARTAEITERRRR